MKGGLKVLSGQETADILRVRNYGDSALNRLFQQNQKSLMRIAAEPDQRGHRSSAQRKFLDSKPSLHARPAARNRG